MSKTNKKADKKVSKNINKKTKHSVLICIAVTVFILVTILVVILIKKSIINKEYKIYEEKMDKYGFSQLYNNKKPKSTEAITTSEAMSIIISGMLDTFDITPYIEKIENPSYNNEMWCEYAYKRGILEDRVTTQDEKVSPKYIDVLVWLATADENLNKNKIDNNINLDYYPKDFNTYSETQKTVLKNLIANGIINNTKGKLNGEEQITKGIFNKIFIDYIEARNLVLFTNEKITNDERLQPKNASDYPFIIETVDKEVYEIPFMSILFQIEKPVDVYKTRKSVYHSIDTKVSKYYETILNIDYETINVDEFYNDILSTSVYYIEKSEVEEYVNYVKENKIKITGNAKIQYPCIYAEGYIYRARTKVNYNLQSSGKTKNVFFRDNYYGKELDYKLGDNEVIIDTPLQSSLNYELSLFVNVKPIYMSVAGNLQDVFSAREPSLEVDLEGE